MQPAYEIFPLGDSAVTIDFGNSINELLNDKVLHMQQWLQAHPFEGLKEIITAYSSLTLQYDPVRIRRHQHVHGTASEWVTAILEKAAAAAVNAVATTGRLLRVPMCYEAEYAPDLEGLAQQHGLTPQECMDIYLSKVYRVYMIGFLPGFSYMGEVDARIATPRKGRAVPVAAGSVGIAGAQTGIYPLHSPGGWHIIGRTPLPLFAPLAEEPVWVRAGDTVQFHAISKQLFLEEQEKHTITGNGHMQ